MPHYQVERTVHIKAPLRQVNDTLRDFRQWPKWSPWLIMEPDATLTFTPRQGQVGATYAWAGMLVGAGSMELLEVHDESLKMDLQFVQPFRSSAQVIFDFEERDDGVEVTWKMEGGLPFFMFWMRSKMEAYIGMDYKRGLRMLKEYIEQGSVASYVHIEGELPLPAGYYIGIPGTSTIDGLGERMRKDFDTLYAYLRAQDLTPAGSPFAVYERFDIPAEETEYIAAVPLREQVATPHGWVEGELPGGNALKTMHKGGYEHLGNAWMTAINFARHKKIRTLLRPVGYEFYLSDPTVTPREELITEIYMPLRSSRGER
jgi:effector-binding domain-containing protein